MPDFSVPHGTTLPALVANLTDELGAIDLTGISSVRFQMRLPGSAVLKVDALAGVVGDPSDGQVSYAWEDEDTDTVGLSLGWFHIAFSSGDTLDAPNPPMVIEVTRGAG